MTCYMFHGISGCFSTKKGCQNFTNKSRTPEYPPLVWAQVLKNICLPLPYANRVHLFPPSPLPSLIYSPPRQESRQQGSQMHIAGCVQRICTHCATEGQFPISDYNLEVSRHWSSCSSSPFEIMKSIKFKFDLCWTFADELPDRNFRLMMNKCQKFRHSMGFTM